ncbi:MAG TPA: formate dehydrogenase accessory sulfurtransferase FdhD [Acidimicrobiales bacterium]
MTRGRSVRVLARRLSGAGAADQGRRPDEVIEEEPLEIRLDDHLVATTMRTPGHDFELAVGLCFTDGLLGGAPVLSCRYCGTGPAADTEFNVVSVDTGGVAPEPLPRLGVTSSACGICGTTQLDDLLLRLDPLAPYEPWDPQVLYAVTEQVRGSQDLYARTGAAHAAAAFDREGTLLVVREDIGRHNAVDKVVGRLLLDGQLPATDRALFVSGRASFEMVQKAWAAGFEAVVAVSAPSGLAVRAATLAGVTLAGFFRGEDFNLYT